MKHTKRIVIVSATVMLSLLSIGYAAADEELAKSSGCLACHTIDQKLVGPAYKEVAAKYKGDADAVDRLTEKVLQGGSGVWGEVAMPPNVLVSKENARKLVEWILSLDK